MAQARVDCTRATPKNPMSTAEVTGKAENCAALAAQPLTDALPERLLDTTERLLALPDLLALISLLAPRRRVGCEAAPLVGQGPRSQPTLLTAHSPRRFTHDRQRE